MALWGPKFKCLKLKTQAKLLLINEITRLVFDRDKPKNWEFGHWFLDFGLLQCYQLDHSLPLRLLYPCFDFVLLEHFGLIITGLLHA